MRSTSSLTSARLLERFSPRPHSLVSGLLVSDHRITFNRPEGQGRAQPLLRLVHLSPRARRIKIYVYRRDAGTDPHRHLVLHLASDGAHIDAYRQATALVRT